MKLEFHLTYRCNLSCGFCNRGCHEHINHTPDMTFDQAIYAVETFMPEVDRIVFIGGEPTLNPDIVPIAKEIRSRWPQIRLFIYSNAYTQHSLDVLEQLKLLGIENNSGTEKPNGSIVHAMQDMFTSPADLGLERITWCTWAARHGSCGYSVDSYGITACSVGGAIDGILDLGLRTWDKAEADARLLDLCRHCGVEYPACHGRGISKTWAEAFKRKDRGDDGCEV